MRDGRERTGRDSVGRTASSDCACDQADVSACTARDASGAPSIDPARLAAAPDETGHAQTGPWPRQRRPCTRQVPTWPSLLAAVVIITAAGVEGWALRRIFKKQGGLTLLVGAVLLWLLGVGTFLLIVLGEFGLLP